MVRFLSSLSLEWNLTGTIPSKAQPLARSFIERAVALLYYYSFQGREGGGRGKRRSEKARRKSVAPEAVAVTVAVACAHPDR